MENPHFNLFAPDDGSFKEYYSDKEIDTLIARGEWTESDKDYYLSVRDTPIGSAGNSKSHENAKSPESASIPGATKIGNMGSRRKW
jgi:hypothetical protein